MIRDMNRNKNHCAAWIARFLKSRKVKFIFGLQGGHIQPIWDHCYKIGIKIVDVRDEKAAVHMAQAYYYLTGKVGVAMVTAGPGVTNTVTAVANAKLSSAGVLIIGGCTPSSQANMGPLQDIPHIEILKSITNYARTARVAEQAIRELDLAFSYSLGHLGEPGPSYIEFPTDVLRSSIKSKLVLNEWLVEKNRFNIIPEINSINRAIKVISKAKRPVIISGRGARDSAKEIKQFIKKSNILYLDTQDSRGLVETTHPNNVYSVRSKVMAEVDLVILIGRRLDYQLAFGSPAIFKKAIFIRISNIAEELLDNRRGDPEILSNPSLALNLISKKTKNYNFEKKWIEKIKKLHQVKIDTLKNKVSIPITKDKKIHPAFIFDSLKKIINEDFIGIADGGDILSFARIGLQSKYYLDSGVFGCLGVGVPYAIAASLVYKNKKVICVTGDGAFGFNAIEIDTAVRNKSNICIIISNNAAWNIETHDQKLNYGNRVYGTTLKHSNYAKMASSLGAYGVRVEKPEELKEAIEKALKFTPSVVDVITSSLVMSSDAKKGLGFVPNYQALDVWDELEKEYRNK